MRNLFFLFLFQIFYFFFSILVLVLLSVIVYGVLCALCFALVGILQKLPSIQQSGSSLDVLNMYVLQFFIVL